MSETQFIKGQAVKVTTGHNHIPACNDTVYKVGSVDRVQGRISVVLMQDGRCIGSIPESCLKAR